MASEISKIENLISQIKGEMGKFLLNQQKLINMSKKIENYKTTKPDLYNELKLNYDFLYNKQKEIEQKAMNWINKTTDYKDKLLLDKDIQDYLTKKQIPSSIFTADFWKKTSQILKDITNFSAEGLSLSSSMLKQNSDVELLEKSIEKGGIINLAKDDLLNSGLVWLYGLIGLGLTYFLINLRKKQKNV
ncbi:MAG: hypothetical protein QW474_01135 [Candidatus Aenigmatarchaeota archaeon]